MFDPRCVANKILDKADERGFEVSNLALNKILFFAHGWHLGVFDGPLVSTNFEAWEHGPVSRDVYHAFKSHTDSPITSRAKMLNFETEEWEVADAELTDELLEFLDRIVDFYGQMTGTKLRAMTHEPGTPWDQVWHSGKIVDIHMKISDDLTKDYFRSIRQA